MLDNTMYPVYMKHYTVFIDQGIHKMPKSTPPRKRRLPQHTMASTKGAWDQLHDMIQECEKLMSLSAASAALLVEKKKLGGNFDNERATALVGVLLKDTREFKSQIEAIKAGLGTNRGDVKEDDMNALLSTLQMAGQLGDWQERWVNIVNPTLEDINKMIQED